jgi:hypothetical protein
MFVSGANPLQVGQSTRVNVTYAVANATNERLDYSATVLFDLGDGVTAVGVTPSQGTATIAPRQVSWGGFVLEPGESATITITLEATPAAGTNGRAVMLITGTTTTARTASGGFVNVRGGALTTAGITGLANGGLVAGGPVAAGAAPLPRVGGGRPQRDAAAGTTAVVTVLVVVATGALFVRRAAKGPDR